MVKLRPNLPRREECDSLQMHGLLRTEVNSLLGKNAEKSNDLQGICLGSDFSEGVT
jgi:hypothetical protein